jgi:transcriptional regulator, MarR family
VLATLRRAGPPYCLSPTQLYKSLLITSGAMTNRLNRLEEVGSIERVADPEDKRSMLVALTDAGREKIEQALLVHTETQRDLLAMLSVDQQQQLQSLLSQLMQASEAQR